jgi:putative glycosyltransferase (TIGR04372 family)
LSIVSVIEQHIGRPKESGPRELVYVFSRIDRMGHFYELYLVRTLFPNFDRYFIVTPSPMKRPIANRAVFDFFRGEMSWVSIDDPEVDAYAEQNSYNNPNYRIFSRGSRLYVLINEERLLHMKYGLIEGGTELPKWNLPKDIIKKGRELEKKFGIREAQHVVTIHMREYNPQRPFERLTRGRNTSVENYRPAIRHLIELGFAVIRIGDATMTPLASSRGELIDLPFHPNREDFADLYFMWRSRFFIGTGAGPGNIPNVFGVPVLLVNMFQRTMFNGPRERLMYRPLFVKALGRRLTYREFVTSPYRDFSLDEEFEQAGVILEENSAEDILSGVKEMIEFVEQGFTVDEEIAAKFRGVDWFAHCTWMMENKFHPYFQPYICHTLPCFEYFKNYPELIADMDIDLSAPRSGSKTHTDTLRLRHLAPTRGWPDPAVSRWLAKFPEDLYSPLMTVSGWYPDGWVAVDSLITVGGGEVDTLIVRGSIPQIDDSKYQADLKVKVDGVMFGQATLRPGEWEVKISIPAAKELRLIELAFSEGQALPVPDGRIVGALIQVIGLASAMPT